MPKRVSQVTDDQADVRLGYDIRTAARMLSVSYHHLFRCTALVRSLKDPLPPGKTVRALPLFLVPGKRSRARIPHSELERLMGLNKEDRRG